MTEEHHLDLAWRPCQLQVRKTSPGHHNLVWESPLMACFLKRAAHGCWGGGAAVDKYVTGAGRRMWGPDCPIQSGRGFSREVSQNTVAGPAPGS